MAKFGYMKVPLTYMVAMVMCIITVMAPWLRVPLAAAQQFTLSVDAREFLEAHNQLRATARVANLVWNDSLAAVAKSFVEQQCASLVPCSSAQGVPAYSSGQNSWCIVANANPQPTSVSQNVASSSHWVTRSFASYDGDHGHHGHCHGEEGDGGSGGGGGAAPAGTVARPAPAPVGSGSAPVPVGSGSAPAPVGAGPVGSITEPPTPLVHSGFGMPPSPNDDSYGNTGTDSSPTPGSSSGGGGPDAAPTAAPIIFPGTGSSNDGEEGDGEGDGEEEGDHHCDGEGDGEGEGEGDGGNAAQYFAQMVDDKTVSTGCYSLQCTANGVSYAACEYFPALPGIPNPPPAPLTN